MFLTIGSCTLDHVFFEDVCEDAITIKQKSGTSRINYGGVRHSIHLEVSPMLIKYRYRPRSVMTRQIYFGC